MWKLRLSPMLSFGKITKGKKRKFISSCLRISPRIKDIVGIKLLFAGTAVPYAFWKRPRSVFCSLCTYLTVYHTDNEETLTVRIKTNSESSICIRNSRCTQLSQIIVCVAWAVLPPYLSYDCVGKIRPYCSDIVKFSHVKEADRTVTCNQTYIRLERWELRTWRRRRCSSYK